MINFLFMVSTSTKNVLLAIFVALTLIAFASTPAFVRADDDEHHGNGHDEHSQLYVQCHDGEDNDDDGYIDLLDSDCAQFRPHCQVGYHSDEQFNCVPNEEQDPICEAPQVLLNHVCVDPQPLSCPEGQVANQEQTQCVDQVPQCVGEQVVVNNQCVDPTCSEGTTLNADSHICVPNAPTCVGAQTLVNNQCVDPVCVEGQTLNTETHMCVTAVVVPACAENQHVENNECVNNVVTPTPPPPPPSGGGGGNGPIVGSLAGGGNGGGGNGPISGTVLGASTSNLPELPAGCSALLNSYMRKGRHNDSNEVKKLQHFLNGELGLSIEETGFFGNDTDAGVRKFQLAHTAEVLAPWGINDSTGYVYKTTQRWINLMSCKSLDIPMPELN